MKEFNVEGIAEVKELLKALPFNVQRRVQNRGLAKAAGKMRTYLRREARAMGGTGTLAKSIGILRTKGRQRKGFVKVGLTKNYFYKTLELGGFTRKGTHYTEGFHPFFEKTVEKHHKEIAQIIIDETSKAIAEVWGKKFGSM